ncbi:hypothetical protein LTR50_001751 [Elasticomyces elasticus]|nr:hypothetical protein LTR50_001751 [Elasticomyces elasticus]
MVLPIKKELTKLGIKYTPRDSKKNRMEEEERDLSMHPTEEEIAEACQDLPPRRARTRFDRDAVRQRTSSPNGSDSATDTEDSNKGSRSGSPSPVAASALPAPAVGGDAPRSRDLLGMEALLEATADDRKKLELARSSQANTHEEQTTRQESLRSGSRKRKLAESDSGIDESPPAASALPAPAVGGDAPRNRDLPGMEAPLETTADSRKKLKTASTRIKIKLVRSSQADTHAEQTTQQESPNASTGATPEASAGPSTDTENHNYTTPASAMEAALRELSGVGTGLPAATSLVTWAGRVASLVQSKRRGRAGQAIADADVATIAYALDTLRANSTAVPRQVIDTDGENSVVTTNTPANRAPFVKGVPAPGRLSITLYTFRNGKGAWRTYRYENDHKLGARVKRTVDWNNQKDITDVGQWSNQIWNRATKGASRKRPDMTRSARYTKAEDAWLLTNGAILNDRSALLEAFNAEVRKQGSGAFGAGRSERTRAGIETHYNNLLKAQKD